MAPFAYSDDKFFYVFLIVKQRGKGMVSFLLLI